MPITSAQAEAVRAQLERLIASAAFKSRKRCQLLLIRIVEHSLAQPKQRGPRRRDPDLPSETEEQLLVQLFLEEENLTAHGGLRQVQLLAGARERAGLGDRPQNLELTQVHGVILSQRRRRTQCR